MGLPPSPGTLMSSVESGATCAVCRHQYYPEDKSTYRACSKCDARMCTICAARDRWICTVCKNPYATLEPVA
jgi:hypothetical protein